MGFADFPAQDFAVCFEGFHDLRSEKHTVLESHLIILAGYQKKEEMFIEISAPLEIKSCKNEMYKYDS